MLCSAEPDRASYAYTLKAFLPIEDSETSCFRKPIGSNSQSLLKVRNATLYSNLELSSRSLVSHFDLLSTLYHLLLDFETPL